MRPFRILGLLLVAAFALSAVAAASASAKEVLYALNKGGFPASFESEGGEAKLVTTGGTEIKCKEVKDTGTLTNAHLGTSEIKFKGCTTKILITLKCSTSGAGAEEIVLKSGVTHLGLADPGDLPATLFLLPEEEGKHQFKFSCGGSGVTVTGDVIGLMQNSKGETPKIGEEMSESKIVFKQTSGKQAFTEFLLALTKPENELMTGQHLHSSSELFGEAESGEETTDTLKNFKNSAGESIKIRLIEG